MSSLLSFLRKDHSRSILAVDHKTTTTLVLCVVFMVMILLKPYVLNMYTLKPRIFVGAVYTILSTLGVWIVRLILKPYSPKKYTNLSEVILVIGSILCAWVLCYLFTETILDILIKKTLGTNYYAIIPDDFFLGSLFNMFTFGLTVYSIVKLYDFKYLLFAKENDPYLKKVTQITSKQISQTQKTIKLEGKNKGENIEIQLKKFVFIKGDGHYININYLTPNNHLETTVLRLSLKEAEDQLQTTTNLFRCHRSYIINTDYLKSIISDSQKSYALLTNHLGEIPVSKKKVATLENLN